MAEILEHINAILVTLSMIVTAIAGIYAGKQRGDRKKAETERDETVAAAQDEVFHAAKGPQLHPSEAQSTAAYAAERIKATAKERATERHGKSKGTGLAMLLALIGLSGCAAPGREPGWLLSDLQRAERRLEKIEEELEQHEKRFGLVDQVNASQAQQIQQATQQAAQIAAQAGKQAAADMVMKPMQTVDDRLWLVGGRLDHAEEGLARAGWEPDPELQAQVDAIKAEAKAKSAEKE